jgi:hypothetical protein
MGQSRRDRQDGTSKTGQAGQARQDGQAEQTDGTGQAEDGCRTRLPTQDCQDTTARTALAEGTGRMGEQNGTGRTVREAEQYSIKRIANFLVRVRITFIRVCKTNKLYKISHFYFFARLARLPRITMIFSQKIDSL